MSDDRRVIVIGSGPSGSMAALALLKQGIPVTVEASVYTVSGLVDAMLAASIIGG